MLLFEAPLSFWIAAAILTAFSVTAALWPIWRKSGRSYEDVNAGTREVLIAQLDELERDKTRGIIEEDQAASARAEIGRRLLALEREGRDEKEDAASRKHTGLQLAMIALIPLFALSIYAFSGVPYLPDQPIAERRQKPTESQDYAVLLDRVEKQLQANPDDVQGWKVLAPVYLGLERFDDAEKAYRQILRINPDDKALLGEAQSNIARILTRKSQGRITQEALALFLKVQENLPDDPIGYFFEALYFTQQEEKETAIAKWQALIARFETTNAPWITMARRTLSDLSAAVNGSGEENVAATQPLAETEQQNLIQGMVQRLADRLEESPDDLTGWSRLIQSYMVLGEREKAGAALTKARASFEGKPEAMTALDAIAERYEL